MLEGRRAEVLRALVEEHIRTGQPVSSRAILERSRLDVSSATVRNDLAALEREGYAVQPHTSAGRVPTATAYRYYVDHLRPAHLRGATHEKIASFFSEVQFELSKLLQATSDLLAEITDLPSVVVAPGVAHDRVRVLHVVQLSSDQILVIVVTEGGRVIQQRGRPETPLTPMEVEEAQELLATVAVGEELGRVTLADDALASAAEPVREAIRTVNDCLHDAAAAGSEMFVGGTRRMAVAWEDLSTIQRVLEILEREAEVLKLLASAPGTYVRMGAELVGGDLDMAVVSRSYDASGEAGSVGVIGPMRMNYKRAISAVEEVTRELEERISSEGD
ncbi:MAG: heat-inducible transcriptional repressor HrcA [Acidimicrobiia bacterium]